MTNLAPKGDKVIPRAELWSACVLLLLGGSAADVAWRLPSEAAPPLALRDVNVISLADGVVLPHQVVLVREGRIEWVGREGGRPLPVDAVVIEGRGRFVMPGLMDMHVHLNRADLPAYLAAGVTTVRNMWGFPEVIEYQQLIARGDIAGPTIISASPGLDGTPPQWPLTQVVVDPSKADSVVQVQVAGGWKYLKVYTRLSPVVFEAIMVAAHRQGIRVVGHVPLQVDINRALQSGMLTIEHLTGYDIAISRTHQGGTWGWINVVDSTMPALASATARAGVWNCPTLAIYAELARQHGEADRQRIIQSRRRFVSELKRAGAPLLVGTDAGIDIVRPGESLHDELAEFEAAGLTRLETLRLATLEAARFLERPDLGRIAPGSVADLLLLRSNPLENLANLRQMDGLVLRGKWIPADSLPGR